jgi:peptidoglycan/xylan/chitin deacetylase (PgdA/CDA1 family)
VLCYHRVLPDGAGGPLADFHRWRGIVVRLEVFERQMSWVARYRKAVTLDAFLAAAEGRGKLPEGACLLTFDDGYRDFLDHALPVLERHGLPSVLFAVAAQAREPQSMAPHDSWYSRLDGPAAIDTDAKRVYDRASPARKSELLGDAPVPHHLARDLYLREDELRALAGRGVAIGGHGSVHDWLPSLSDGELEANLGDCLEWVRRLRPYGTPVLAYPHGAVDDRVARAASAAGFRAAFTIEPYDALPAKDVFRLGRWIVPDRDEFV